MSSADSGVLLTILVFVGASVSYTALIWIVDSWPKRQSASDTLTACPICSYSFAGLAAQSPCPECGASFKRQLVIAQHKARLRFRNYFPIGVLLVLFLGFISTVLFAILIEGPRPRDVIPATLFLGFPFMLLIPSLPIVARRTSQTNLIIWAALGTLSILIAQAIITWHIAVATDPEAGMAIIGAPCLGSITLPFGLLLTAVALHKSSRRNITPPPN